MRGQVGGAPEAQEKVAPVPCVASVQYRPGGGGAGKTRWAARSRRQKREPQRVPADPGPNPRSPSSPHTPGLGDPPRDGRYSPEGHCPVSLAGCSRLKGVNFTSHLEFSPCRSSSPIPFSKNQQKGICESCELREASGSH